MSMANPTIEDFLAHRWAEAQEALRTLDPAFVTTLENEVWLQDVGLVVPWRVAGALLPLPMR